jgi:hypothetical protein
MQCNGYWHLSCIAVFSIVFSLRQKTPRPYPTRSLSIQFWHWCIEWSFVLVSSKPLIAEEILPGRGLIPGLPNDTLLALMIIFCHSFRHSRTGSSSSSSSPSSSWSSSSSTYERKVDGTGGSSYSVKKVTMTSLRVIVPHKKKTYQDMYVHT